MIRVLIADSYPIIRYGLKQILAQTVDVEVTDEVESRNKLFDKASISRCDVLLLEATPCDIAGLELLTELKYAHPSLAILTVGIHTEVEFNIRALRAGALGHITIDSTPDEFIRAIRMVADGRRYISPELAEALAYGLQNDTGQPAHRSLTDREYQVMCMLGSGKTPTQAARMLGLAKTTIATYRKRILEKLNLQSNVDIIRYTVENKLVTDMV